MRIPFIYGAYIFLLISIFSCRKDSERISDYGFSYFPSNIGHELVYDVDSIAKDDFTNHIDTFHFQIKEVIESVFTDNEGRPTLRLERYKRLESSDPWIIYKIWTANLVASAVEKKEDNVIYVKLAFPLASKKKWNGNAKNDNGERFYEYTSVNVPESLNNFAFDSALTVLQNDEDIAYYKKDFSTEKYAIGVGMIYKEIFLGIYDQNPNATEPFEAFIAYKEKLISYNN